MNVARFFSLARQGFHMLSTSKINAYQDDADHKKAVFFDFCFLCQ
jgi:hypothetical protein